METGSRGNRGFEVLGCGMCGGCQGRNSEGGRANRLKGKGQQGKRSSGPREEGLFYVFVVV